MRRLFLFSLAVLVLLSAAILSVTSRAQTPSQIGDFYFTLPPGWTQSQQPGSAMLTAPPTTVGHITAILLSTSPLQTDLKTTYQSQLGDLQNTYIVKPVSQEIIQQLPGGYQALFASAVLSNPAGAQLAAVYVLARNGDRAEGMLFLTNETDPNAFAANKKALELFLGSLRFASAGPSGPPPKAVDPGVKFSLPPGIVPPDPAETGVPGPGVTPTNVPPPNVGGSTTPGGPPRFAAVFRASARQGEDPTSNLSIGDAASKTPNFKFLVFFPDGRVKRGLINQGFDGFIQESSMRLDISSGGKFATQWGIYQLTNGRGAIQFASAIGGQQLVSGLRGDVFNVVQYPDHLVVNGETYLLLDCPAGLKLNGVYKPFGDARQHGIQFTPDGQFHDEGIFATNTAMAVGMSGGGVGIAYGFAPPQGGAGAYSVSNYGLHMYYATSQAPTPLFFVEPGSSPNDVRIFYIGNVKFQRVR